MHRKAGIRWAMLALTEQHQPCHNSDQYLYYVQQEKDTLVSLGRRSLEGAVWGSRRRKLRWLTFAYTG